MIRRLLRLSAWLVGGTVALVLMVVLGLWGAFAWNASRSDWPRIGPMAGESRPAETVAAEDAGRREAGVRLGAASQKQILFGDLHVHTGFSTDAMAQTVPLLNGEGSHPPGEACDFARFCSALDFWSINDHAESLTPAEWTETRRLVRECNQVGQREGNPDTVAFLGWEWSQGGSTPQTHFGHKNVVLLGTEDDEVPARPIGAGATGSLVWGVLGLSTSLGDTGRWDQYADLHRSTLANLGMSDCPQGVDVHDLPADCYEQASTPDVLFEKLDQWGFPALVIPHGLGWGVTNPVGNDLALQLRPGMHDPSRQRLLEIYSGHGNSERFTPSIPIERPHGSICPPATADYEPCCWRAGEIVRARCADPESTECERQVAAAREEVASRLPFLSPHRSIDGATIDDFGDCDQFRAPFLPAFDYRPGGSAQYGLAVAAFDGERPTSRFRFGLMAASDNHRARAGSGYKEFGRTWMTDGSPSGSDFRDERVSGFYYTGGLTAVHAAGRDRESIFAALQRREVYGTSGDRILLWFDLRRPDGTTVPMGSEVASGDVPRFEVRAAGAFEQLPGCPAWTSERLAEDRLRRLCLGECHHPGERRRRITRIEVVRIRPQMRPDEAVEGLIEDPWLVLPCGSEEEGCHVEFEDPQFVVSGREALYYVRAIQERTAAVNGDPLRCERDADGRCVRPHRCRGGGAEGLPVDDCLAEVEERAWSSPIFVVPPA